MDNDKYYVVQDGDLVEPHIDQLFSSAMEEKDCTPSREGERYNFVGFIYCNQKMLISFPKHSFRSAEMKRLSHNVAALNKLARTLFHCIKRTADRQSEKYAGIRDELAADYPFSDFFEVYKYYKRYGLFTNETEIKKFGYGGKISWKDTFHKSPKIVQNHNVLFLPLMIKENIEQHVFISKCMAYVIDSTLTKFSFFLEGDKTNLDTRDIDFLNTSLVVSQLKKARRTLFKNIHQRLVDSLISFFVHNHKRGGNDQLKIYSFHLVWESMVQVLLRTKFDGLNDRLELQWSDTLKSNDFMKKIAYPDIRGESGFRIEPDYYFISGNQRYIFDAKYYQELKALDYKQVAYYFLLKHYETINELETYNALILPTEEEEHSQVHFELNPEYNLNERRFMIMAYYLNTVNVMRYYANLS